MWACPRASHGSRACSTICCAVMTTWLLFRTIHYVILRASSQKQKKSGEDNLVCVGRRTHIHLLSEMSHVGQTWALWDLPVSNPSPIIAGFAASWEHITEPRFCHEFLELKLKFSFFQGQCLTDWTIIPVLKALLNVLFLMRRETGI